MKVYYFSSGEFGAYVLEQLILEGLHVDKVVTIPKRRKGRGRKLQASEVHKVASKFNLNVLEAEDPHTIPFEERPDFIVVVDYGRILKRSLLELPRIAPLNVHPSLLPMYRGASPIERAMMDGYPLGVSVIVMNENVDAGDIVHQERVDYTIEETKGDVLPRLVSKAVELLLRSMDDFLKGKAKPVKQTGKGSYAKKISREELYVDFKDDAKSIVRKINALSPKPTARASIDGMNVKLYRAKPSSIQVEPGKLHVEKGRLFVGAYGGSVEIVEIQPQNRRIMHARDFINGYLKNR